MKINEFRDSRLILLGYWALSLPPENIRKPEVFWFFRGSRKRPVVWNNDLNWCFHFHRIPRGDIFYIQVPNHYTRIFSYEIFFFKFGSISFKLKTLETNTLWYLPKHKSRKPVEIFWKFFSLRFFILWDLNYCGKVCYDNICNETFSSN